MSTVLPDWKQNDATHVHTQTRLETLYKPIGLTKTCHIFKPIDAELGIITADEELCSAHTTGSGT